MGPNFTIPRNVHLTLQAIALLALPFEFVEYAVRRPWLVFCSLFAIAALGAGALLEFVIRRPWMVFCSLVAIATLGVSAWEATGMGVPMGDRVTDLCQRLGYPSSDCTFLYEPGRGFGAYLDISVDEDLSEPDAEPYLNHVHATSITIRPQGRWNGSGGPIGQTYQINSDEGPYGEGWEYLNVLVNLWTPACAFPECVERRLQDEGYTGVTEQQLTDVANVVSHLLYQAADAQLTAALQQSQGAGGLPIVTAVGSAHVELGDHSGPDAIATTFSAPVLIRFACAWPADGCVP